MKKESKLVSRLSDIPVREEGVCVHGRTALDHLYYSHSSLCVYGPDQTDRDQGSVGVKHIYKINCLPVGDFQVKQKAQSVPLGDPSRGEMTNSDMEIKGGGGGG
jgi:hypothetical protein